MDFEEAHNDFIEGHLARRSGERKERLIRGHNYAEKLLLQHVWWPLFRSFDHLHPEYEVYDWNRKSQFLDFQKIGEINWTISNDEAPMGTKTGNELYIFQ